MALGTYNYNQNNSRDEIKRPSINGFIFSNDEASHDKVALSFSMWKNLLKFSFCPVLNTGKADFVSYDHDNSLDIYLNATKSTMLSMYLDEFAKEYKKDHNTTFNRAIQVNTGVISINNGVYIGENGVPSITGFKMNESGNIGSKFNYELKVGKEFGIIDYNEDTGDYDTETDPFITIEICQISLQCREFAKACTNAQAYAVADRLSFEFYKAANERNKIAEKLGVDLSYASRNSYRNNSYTKSSYFSNKSSSDRSNTSQNNMTLDELSMS